MKRAMVWYQADYQVLRLGLGGVGRLVGLVSMESSLEKWPVIHTSCPLNNCGFPDFFFVFLETQLPCSFIRSTKK
jgi:hypothetical protein